MAEDDTDSCTSTHMNTHHVVIQPLRGHHLKYWRSEGSHVLCLEQVRPEQAHPVVCGSC